MVKRHISNFLKENPLVIPAAALALAAYSGFFRIKPLQSEFIKSILPKVTLSAFENFDGNSEEI
ncbi:MAG: hypothetical protein K2F89_09400 [Treponemataceae bacterium]|nr:hypothetical protein [Treponemataceae bacterium]